MSFDGKAFGKEIVSIVKDYVERKTQALEHRVDALEGGEKAEKPRVRTKTNKGLHFQTEEEFRSWLERQPRDRAR